MNMAILIDHIIHLASSRELNTSIVPLTDPSVLTPCLIIGLLLDLHLCGFNTLGVKMKHT